jgi:hypothetical protein
MIREKLANLKTQVPQEKTINQVALSPQDSANKIPLIKTFQSDLMEGGDATKLSQMQNNISQSYNIQSVADNLKTRKKIMVIAASILALLLIIGGGVYYYMYTQKKAAEEKVAAELKKSQQIKRYYISDVWPEVSRDALLKENTGEATSTKDVIVINVKNFEKVYDYLIDNEKKMTGLATGKFDYTNLGDFQDATIENIDMRIADCNEGPVVYGYVDKDKLIITNDIDRYIKNYKAVKGIK